MSVKKDLFSGAFYTAISKYSGMLISLVIAEYFHVCWFLKILVLSQ